jgi:hypothetical protein
MQQTLSGTRHQAETEVAYISLQLSSTLSTFRINIRSRIVDNYSEERVIPHVKEIT